MLRFLSQLGATWLAWCSGGASRPRGTCHPRRCAHQRHATHLRATLHHHLWGLLWGHTPQHRMPERRLLHWHAGPLYSAKGHLGCSGGHAVSEERQWIDGLGGWWSSRGGVYLHSRYRNALASLQLGRSKGSKKTKKNRLLSPVTIPPSCNTRKGE